MFTYQRGCKEEGELQTRSKSSSLLVLFPKVESLKATFSLVQL